METAEGMTQRVWVDAAPTPEAEATPVGRLDARVVADSVVSASFRYDKNYLALPGAFPVSPELPLSAAKQTFAAVPGAFVDASADTWGQKLIRRRLRADGVAAATELSSLLGVRDEARIGALRFRTADEYAWPESGAVPAEIDIRDLQRAANRVAHGRVAADEAIAEVLDAGTALLGGARPKAFVRRRGRALLAKFPAPDDEHDVIRWELISLAIAHRAGVRTPAVRALAIGGRRVLLEDRFDRVGRDADGSGGDERRVHYWSARTAVGVGGDYLDLAGVIREQGGKKERAQLRQLWRRVAFAVAMRCTDDHLRNLGFVRQGTRWVLSPVFDVEPDPVPGRSRSTSIAGAVDAVDEPAALVELARRLEIKKPVWRRMLGEVLAAVDTCEEVAVDHGLSVTERDELSVIVRRQRTALLPLLG